MGQTVSNAGNQKEKNWDRNHKGAKNSTDTFRVWKATIDRSFCPVAETSSSNARTDLFERVRRDLNVDLTKRVKVHCCSGCDKDLRLMVKPALSHCQKVILETYAERPVPRSKFPACRRFSAKWEPWRQLSAASAEFLPFGFFLFLAFRVKTRKRLGSGRSSLTTHMQCFRVSLGKICGSHDALCGYFSQSGNGVPTGKREEEKTGVIPKVIL